MLILSRKQQQEIRIGDEITITILKIKGQAVRVGIEAPRGIRVLRGELQQFASSLPEAKGQETGTSEREPSKNSSGEAMASERFSSRADWLATPPRPASGRSLGEQTENLQSATHSESVDLAGITTLPGLHVSNWRGEESTRAPLAGRVNRSRR